MKTNIAELPVFDPSLRPTGIDVGVYQITPAVAEELMKRNKNFRPVSKSRIKPMAADICEGRWEFNNASFALDEKGDLIDGQHRMLAVIAAGKPIAGIVVQPVDGDLCIDTGARRQLRDYLRKHGAADFPGECATVLRDMAMLMRGATPNYGFISASLTNPILNDLWKRECPSIVASVARLIPAVERLGRLFATICATSHLMFAKLDAPLAEQFAACMTGEETFAAKDPFTVLSETYIRELQKLRKLSRTHYLAFSIMSWNRRRKGEKGIPLRWMARKQDFPTIE